MTTGRVILEADFPSEPHAPDPNAELPSDPRLKRLLMISCVFPPTGGPGVQRSAKFAKYLPQFGWRPIVWTADHMSDLPSDATLLTDLPATVQVHRQAHHACGDRIRRVLGHWRSDRTTFTPDGAQTNLPWRIEKLCHAIRGRLIPDDMVFWALRSYRPARRLIEQTNINVIFSTFSPASNHLLGLMLHRATGRPWVADFRDLWTDDYCYPRHGRTRRWIERGLEQRILNSADAVIGVSESQTRLLRERVPNQPEKFVTITNGVDLDDFTNIDPTFARKRLHGRDDTFVLSFTGWFLSDRVSTALIEGLARFGDWLHDQSGHFELRVVGAISENMKKRLPHNSISITTTGYLPHQQAIEQMMAADALLLLTPTGRNAETLIPGKTFEYFAAGRPILCVGSPGNSEAARLVERCAAGVCVSPEAEAIRGALEHLWRTWRAGRPVAGCRPEQLGQFTRSHLTGQLSDLLDGVLRADRLKGRTALSRRRVAGGKI